MENAVIISWTPTNWVTIFLMALGGFLILHAGVMGVRYITTGNANA